MRYLVSFVLDKEKGKEDAKLRMRVRWNGNLVAWSVGYRVDVRKWSAQAQRCVRNSTHGKRKINAIVINHEIDRYEKAVNDAFLLFRTSPTKDELKNAVNANLGKAGETPLLVSDVIDRFMDVVGRENAWTKATFQKFRALKRHLTDFDQLLKVSDIDNDILYSFTEFLSDSLALRNSTILKQVDFVKWFLKWCARNGYEVKEECLSFSPKLKTSERHVIFLDWDELMRVYHADFKRRSLEQVRDVFCFCCFTSLRYSDVANLKRANIFDSYITITTIKTSDNVTIELNDYSKAILDKYKDYPFDDDKVLPVISNQKMNEQLKEIMRLCGIDKPTMVTYYRGNRRFEEIRPKWQLIGTHCGRRTFICNALMMGISPQIVMKWSGHANYESMKPYIDIADRAKADAMALFNKKR